MINPTYDRVQVGDTYQGGSLATLSAGFMYTSTVLAMEEVSTRFGHPDRIVTVRVESTRGTS